jgi:ankyrin repeat protein
MLKHGADVRSVDRVGEELLSGVVAMAVAENKKAKREEYVQVIHALIENGASPNSRSKEGIPLVVLAISQPMVLRALIDAGAIKDVAWQGLDMKPAIEEALANDPDAPTNPRTPTS